MPISRLAASTEYASWPVEPPPGIAITTDVAQVAFRGAGTQTPWQPAQIVVDAVRYGDPAPRFRFLLGPAGITPGPGSWRIVGQITDSPEAPVFELDTLLLRP